MTKYRAREGIKRQGRMAWRNRASTGDSLNINIMFIKDGKSEKSRMCSNPRSELAEIENHISCVSDIALSWSK